MERRVVLVEYSRVSGFARYVTSVTLPLGIQLTWIHLVKGQAGREGPRVSCLFVTKVRSTLSQNCTC